MLERTGQKAKAAAAANVTISAVHKRRQRDPEFATAERAALEVAKDIVESEIFRRAVEGVPRKYFGRDGKVTSVTQEYSDTLLIRLAERLEGGSWRQKQQIEPPPPGVFATRAERKAQLEKLRQETREREARSLSGTVPLSVQEKGA